MPFICIYIHFVWTTKNRIPFLNTPALRLEVWKHIRKYALDQGIHVDFVGGYEDHCHCLVSLNNNQSPDMIMQLLKGESARFVNRSTLSEIGFDWQDGYYAAAVQFERVDLVREYIKNQETHHREHSFTDEYEQLLRKSGFKKIEMDPFYKCYALK